MKDFQARVYTEDAEPVVEVFDAKGMAKGPGVYLSLVSVLDCPGMLGQEILVSVGVSFDEQAMPDTAANYIHTSLIGDSNAILMVYDETASTAREIEEMLRRENDL
ncbi:hypothetical protein JCM15519_11210 [Fundidesulfovibrio butyratiphilus]